VPIGIDVTSSARPGAAYNSLSQGSEFQHPPALEDEDSRVDAPVFESEDLIDIGNGRKFLLAGDLVELV